MSHQAAPAGPARVEVVIPVRDGESRVAATVAGARAIAGVRRVVVVDDGSNDRSAEVARSAGAEVVRLAVNGGKAAAVRAGAAHCGSADVILLLDADLGATAGAAAPLLAPVVAGEADMSIGVLPGAGRRGGVGVVRRLASAGVRAGCGFRTRAPLSGQRAVRRELLDTLGPVDRFGLEVALTIDAVRAGARVVELDITVDHAHTGRRVAGFAHRGRQGVDVLRALWPRLTTPAHRVGLVVAAAVVFVVGSFALSPGTDLGEPLDPGVEQVVVVGIAGLGLDDVARMPALDRMARDGALAATNVRTGGDTPRPVAAYATLSAGVRVDALDSGARVETGAGGGVEVPALAATRGAAGRYVTSDPGALGAALGDAGRHTGLVAPATSVGPSEEGRVVTGAAGLAATDAQGRVEVGTIDPDALRLPDGRSDPDAVGGAVDDALTRADLVVVDPGDTAALSGGTDAERDAARPAALAATNATLDAIAQTVGPETLLIVVGVTPPTREWALTPTVAWGAGVDEHRLASPTTRRDDLVTLTDIGPTVLAALGVPRPPGMTGQALRGREGTVDRDRLEGLNDVARGREATYFRMTITFIAIQVAVHLATWSLLARGRLRPGAARTVRALTVVCAAWPLATYLVRAVPVLMTLGPGTHLAPWPVAIALAVVASRFGRHPLAPVAMISAATAALIAADLATGGRLQVASVLGTAPHTTYRFNGLGNVGFAVLASSALVAVGIHVDAAPRRREALVTGACALGVVAVADVAPWMGADVGGILTLLPVFGLTLLALSGRRLRVRTLLLAVAVTVAGLAVVLGVDLLRPPEARTHLARFVTETVADGDLGSTVGRRWAANTRMFTQSAWTWAVVPLAVGSALAVARSRWLADRAPMGAATRVGVLGALAAGLAGWLLNDSGVVVTALVLIYVPAVLTVVAMERVRGRPGPVPRTHQ